MTDEVRQPNVLFIICDQLRADHLGFAGNTVVRTPNIDRLAGRSVVFERAYVANGLCMPNRSSIMTGQMPSSHGAIFNDRSLDPANNTFVRRLREAGYATSLVGKSHFQHGTSRETVRPLGNGPGRISPYERGWDTFEHWERYTTGETVAPEDYYGFSRIELALGHGAQVEGHHWQWAVANGADPDVLATGIDPEAPIPGRSEHWWQVSPAPYAEEFHSTNFITEKAIDCMREGAVAGQPWMVWCSYPDPHQPMMIPEPWFSRHAPSDMELPATFDDLGADWAPHLHAIRNSDALPMWAANPRPFGPTREQALDAIAATYGMIEAIDAGVGQLLTTIDELGADGDTVVVFTTDHGDMMGDHGLMLKVAMHYQGVIRTPLTIKAPGYEPGRTRSLSSSIDLPHTILDLCGVPDFQGMQGTSLTPVLADPSSAVRDAVYVEEDFPRFDPRAPNPEHTRTIVTADARYTRDSAGNETLYDLDGDPDELVNLAVDSRDPARRVAMVDALTDLMIGTSFTARLEPVSVDVPA